MIYVGIDVSKDKHDCTIVSSDGEVLADVFTIQNNMDGFKLLFQRLQSVAPDLSKVKVGLEATGRFYPKICVNSKAVQNDRSLKGSGQRIYPMSACVHHSMPGGRSQGRRNA